MKDYDVYFYKGFKEDENFWKKCFEKEKSSTETTEEMEKNYKIEKLKKQLKIAKKYLSLIKRNVSVGSLAYTYVANAQTEIKELEK